MKSPSKQRLKVLSKLKQKKFRINECNSFIEGARTIRQLIDDRIEIEELYCCSNSIKDFTDILISVPEDRCYVVEENQLKQISSTPSPQKIIAIVASKQVPIKQHEKLLYLDRVADPTNVGTIFRTAAAFGIDGIVLSDGCCEVFNPKTIRSSVGKVFTVPFAYEEEFDLSSFEGEIIVADMRGDIPIYKLEVDKPFIVVLGSEAAGVREEIFMMSSKKVFIPMKNRLESLNVAAAATIFMYRLGSRSLE